MADPLDNTVPLPSDPLDNTASPAAGAPAAAAATASGAKEKRAKGFLLSARSAQDLPPAEEMEAVSIDDDRAADASEDTDTAAPVGKLQPKKKGGKKKGTGKGTPKSASKQPKDEAAGPASAEVAASPTKKGNKLEGGMISRRPGGLAAFLPEDDDEEMVEENEPSDAAVSSIPPPDAALSSGGSPGGSVGSPVPEAVPQTWQEATRQVNYDAEVPNVQFKNEKNKRLSRMMSRKKREKKGGFEARAKLAYYGSIGGGFGTPRVGFAPGQFNTPTWMATTSSGTLVVSSTFAHEVQVLSPRGAPTSVITAFQGVPLHDPQGIAIKGDSMYIADGGNGRVLKFKLKDGVYTPELSTQAGLMDLPQGLAYHEAGKTESLLFVVCGRMNRVHVLDPKTLKRCFSFGGEKGTAAAGQLNDPTCVAIYDPPATGNMPGVFGGRSRQLVYVTDTENDRIAVFSMDGDFVAGIGKHGRAPGDFVEPLGLAIREQQLFVAEGGRGIGGRLQVLSPDGTPLLVLPAPTGGRLVGVHWHETRLYVSEIEAHRLHSFKIVT